jgi:GT2 family glycosyltransferase/ADP-heptose:LPS heptosyltransferase/predicted SAM-dependent methyltransferase
MSKKFTLIIPTVKQTTMVRECIESILKAEPDQSLYEILVVDDGSDKAVQRWLKDLCTSLGVRILLKDVNRGFAHTVNFGMANSTSDYLVLVNNDITFKDRFLPGFLEAFASDNKIGVVGAKLLYPDGSVQHAGVVRRPNSPDFLHVHKGVLQNDPVVCQSRYYISVTGALFAISRQAYERVGVLNENYFVACEDTEYCLRVWASNLRVFFNHKIQATHQEGGTRGNTDSTKLKKGPEWFLKERETIAKFLKDFANYEVEKFEDRIRSLNHVLVEASKPKTASPAKLPSSIRAANSQPIKLEIGCGYNPQPGFLHLDVRPLPDVEYVCDFSKEPLPFEDNSLDEILSNHSIEHISWRGLPFVVGEWFRTLKPGGRVFLRTPDLEYIARSYLDGKTTPEWPGDEQYLTDNLSSEITPGWWANLKLYAGQDYPSNYHFMCFDFDMIKAFFERIGFTDVARLQIKPVFSSGELQVEAFKPAEQEVVSADPKRIWLKRTGALGDVLLTTPIARKLRHDNPGATIYVATNSPAAYVGNPDVNRVVSTDAVALGEGDQVVDLDLAYERRPKLHIIDAYAEAAFGVKLADKIFDKSTYLAVSANDLAIALDAVQGFDLKNTVAVHMAVTWKNRTFSKEFWNQVLCKLRGYGLGVVQLGAGGDISFPLATKFPGAGPIIDLTNKLSIAQVAALIGKVGCFLGNDSSLIHVAGTTQTPIVGLFTSAKPELRLPYRGGIMGANCKALVPSVSCAGCLHNEPAPVVYCDCRRGDFICLSQINPDTVVEAVRASLRGRAV